MATCKKCGWDKRLHDRDVRFDLTSGKTVVAKPGESNSRVCLLVPNEEGTAMRPDHEEYRKRDAKLYERRRAERAAERELLLPSSLAPTASFSS